MEQYKFQNYNEGIGILRIAGFRIGGLILEEFVFPEREVDGNYLKGLPESFPASGIPWPVGELRRDGTFIFDDSTNPTVEEYKQRIRERLGIQNKQLPGVTQ